jgi:hypothetical protein
MPDRYDIADPNDPTTLRIPFMFVPRGCEPDPEWLRKHPGAIRFPATMVPREPAAGGTQWNVQFAWPEPLTAESLPPPPSRAKATISVPIDRRDDLPGDDSQRTPDAPPPAPLTLDDPAVAYTLWTGEDPIDVWRRMSAVFDDPIGAIKGTLLAAQTTASSGAPNVVASPSRIEASRADERAAPVPLPPAYQRARFSKFKTGGRVTANTPPEPKWMRRILIFPRETSEIPILATASMNPARSTR